ncbi:ErpL protein [Borreliella turdi]|uniref:ErpL protein n=1 Tax=Borreliella turdi TaxID=57863 RepID=UPI001247318F|nr:ErpL protein [Borreliella turdi]
MKKKIRMFVICIFFLLINSCKYYASNKDLKSGEQSSESSDSKLSKSEKDLKKRVKGFLDILETEDLSKLDEQDTKEIEKTIKNLKDKILKTDVKKTLIGTYLKYEKTVKEIRARLKDKKELEDSLKELEDSLKKKKEERKQKLEEAKQKFKGFKDQVSYANGVTQGEQVRGQGTIGQQAWIEAQKLGLSVNSSNSADTSDMSRGIVDGAIKQIEEELKKVGNKKE